MTRKWPARWNGRKPMRPSTCRRCASDPTDCLLPAVVKHHSERVRATVTSGLSETRALSSSLDWQLLPSTSVQLRYDSVDDLPTSGFGNVRLDLRWRLELE